MPAYKLDHDKCEDAVVNDNDGFCQHYLWNGDVCYCSIPLVPVNLGHGGMLRCPYAYRIHHKPNIIPGYEWTEDL